MGFLQPLSTRKSGCGDGVTVDDQAKGGKGDVVKTIGLFGLLSLLSILAYSRIASAPSEAAQGPDRSVTMLAPVAMEGGGTLPARLSEYVFLHQNRQEIILVRAVADVKACPD
jgi:hypothetical protein